MKNEHVKVSSYLVLKEQFMAYLDPPYQGDSLELAHLHVIRGVVNERIKELEWRRINK